MMKNKHIAMSCPQRLEEVTYWQLSVSFSWFSPKKINQLWSWKMFKIDISVKVDFNFSTLQMLPEGRIGPDRPW